MVEPGTRQLFLQSSAPEGWTRYTDSTIDNVAFRIVSGTSGGSTGGNLAFSSTFASRSVSNFSLTRSQTAIHNHSLRGGSSGGGGHRRSQSANNNINPNQLSGAGSSLSHSHTVDLRVRYLSVMIATKDA